MQYSSSAHPIIDRRTGSRLGARVCPRVAHIHNLHGWKPAERKVEIPIEPPGSEADEWPWQPTHFVVTLGDRGARYIGADGEFEVPAPVVEAVDTTGAGDIFNAAFAVACSEGASRLDACQFAVHAAAISVTRMGCQASVPTRAELDAYLRQT